MDITTLKAIIELVEHRIKVIDDALNDSPTNIGEINLRIRKEELQMMLIAFNNLLIAQYKFDIAVKSN